MEVRSRNHCCRGKAISITYSEDVSVALGMQHAKIMRRIILSPVTCPALQYFSALSHKRHDFRGGGDTEDKMTLLIFSTTFAWNISHSRKNSERHEVSSVFMLNYPSFLSDFNETLIFWQIFKKYSNTTFHENLSSGCRDVLCGRIDGRTDGQTWRSSYLLF